MEGKHSAARKPEGFPRRYRLGRNKNFRFVYRRGKSTPSAHFTLVHLKGKEQQFGFSVSGKVGNAVTRNRIRRWLREDVRRMRTECKCGKYIFVARPSARTLAHETMTAEVRALLARAKLLRDKV